MIDFRCPVNGVLEQSLCAKGAPIAMSLPHFLYANESYRQHVEGLKPNIEKHEFYFDIEPVSIILRPYLNLPENRLRFISFGLLSN